MADIPPPPQIAARQDGQVDRTALFHVLDEGLRQRRAASLSYSVLYGFWARVVKLFGDRYPYVRKLPDVLAIKISLPRRPPSGAVGDSDIYGCQAMAPLAALSMGEAQP